MSAKTRQPSRGWQYRSTNANLTLGWNIGCSSPRRCHYDSRQMRTHRSRPLVTAMSPQTRRRHVGRTPQLRGDKERPMRLPRICMASFALGTTWIAIPAVGEEKSKNLLVNGSFEDGPDAGDFLPLDPGSTDIKGWTVTRAQIDYIGGHWKSADGSRSVDLHGSPGLGGVKQVFATTKGRKYKVTFSMAANPNFQPESGPVKILCVRAAGKKEAFSFDAAEKTVAEMGWVTKTWEFTAIGEETTLEFHTLESDDPSCGPALDNVSVLPVN